jgi:glucuronate isomerase
MTQVKTVYQTTDDKIFLSSKDALEHQEAINKHHCKVFNAWHNQNVEIEIEGDHYLFRIRHRDAVTDHWEYVCFGLDNAKRLKYSLDEWVNKLESRHNRG